MGALQQLFRAHGPAYLERFANAPANHRKVLAAIQRCRSDQAGHILYHCQDCGKPHRIARGCGNRHCPNCQHHKTQAWLQCALDRQLPGHHFMITFTVPEALRAFLRSNQRVGYEALFQASSGAIKTLAADPRFFGAPMPGLLGVLHTWGQQLQYHPHIHYLVPGGAISPHDRQWHPSSPGFYLPVHALSRLFRAKFHDAIAAHGLLADIAPALWHIDWNVHCQPAGDGQATLGYLARYVFRVAIAERRIGHVDERSVQFRYRKPHSNRLRTMALPIDEFIRRFLQHVLPTGFQKVRRFGFLSPTCAVPIQEVRDRIAMASGFADEASSDPIELAPPEPMRCPHCGALLRFMRVIAPPDRVRRSDPNAIPIDTTMRARSRAGP